MLLFVLIATLLGSCTATHFRFATFTWQRDTPTSTTVKFLVQSGKCLYESLLVRCYDLCAVVFNAVVVLHVVVILCRLASGMAGLVVEL